MPAKPKDVALWPAAPSWGAEAEPRSPWPWTLGWELLPLLSSSCCPEKGLTQPQLRCWEGGSSGPGTPAPPSHCTSAQPPPQAYRCLLTSAFFACDEWELSQERFCKNPHGCLRWSDTPSVLYRNDSSLQRLCGTLPNLDPFVWS